MAKTLKIIGCLFTGILAIFFPIIALFLLWRIHVLKKTDLLQYERWIIRYFCFTVFIIPLFFLMFILPSFSNIFEGQEDLPVLTVMLVRLSEICQRYVIVPLVVLVLLYWGCYRLLMKYKDRWPRLLSRLFWSLVFFYIVYGGFSTWAWFAPMP